MKILAVCGSLQARSGNLDLLRSAARLAPAGVEVVQFDGVRLLPLFNPDLEAPAPVAEWRQRLADCDAVLIATPEYGHSLPGALKNAIDWVIGSGELHRKVVAITASVRSPERGLRGLSALRDTLLAIDAQISSDTAIVLGPESDDELRELLNMLVAKAQTSSPLAP